ncbi:MULTISPECIES: ABC transporter ATP-binding protein [Streptomycetaceae]|uniref:ABC transporter related protein n=1 Tax=Streptantibioticus cattleyicolor (strain ATCC 35852 / DSM 46488 / JCM 4925 / NBRC 14057 / NRRL 8057) TaxID=1003195 RepID=F8JTQ8_STREN|nr:MULTISPECIES: ATP-binding cassette domain-containing protein [Streptomycetaceae]AEW96825.1 ABC transporter related protein [Streptantibioticus cattleyicolor NRRL 8057 = DSM 46488]MYS61306.1 ATP-binding cassette domain-containing protein [Streptomyces sp. SID5468]CCB77155.1 Lipoprotein-releasing system ATP-binding protein lolD [Streptantibioticus cattleyicolor NRRL 8057 = DSM 46488]
MTAPPGNHLLWARGLRCSHQGSPALLGATVGVPPGEILAVLGPRGAGKSTLLACLSGQLRPEAGEVWFDGTPLHSRSRGARERLRRDRFGWVGPVPGLVPELTARENAALPLLLRGASYRTARRAADEWLERLDVAPLARRRPADLLQSQRQRVAVARALVTVPDVLFADEPTAPLHRPDQAHVLRALTTAARTHRITVVLATHDPEAARYADRTVPILDGLLDAGPAGPAQEGTAPCVTSA